VASAATSRSTRIQHSPHALTRSLQERYRCPLEPSELHPGANMQVTEVRVYPASEGLVRAYVTITLDNCFAIRDLRIIQNAAGYLIAMPNRKQKDGAYRDIAYPINAETRRMIEEAVMAEYKKAVPNGVLAQVREKREE
jgi:stage V sporulation protein G